MVRTSIPVKLAYTLIIRATGPRINMQANARCVAVCRAFGEDPPLHGVHTTGCEDRQHFGCATPIKAQHASATSAGRSLRDADHRKRWHARAA